MFSKADVTDVKVGDILKLIYVEGEPQMTGLVGRVKLIDDAGQIHGTWGGAAVCPAYGDKYEIIN